MALTFCELFLEFLRRNAMVAVVILAVLLARLLLKKLPKKYAYALWSVVALRMIFSFDIPSFFSIFNVFVHAGHDGVLPESDRMMPVHVIPGNTAGAGQTVWAVPDAVTEAASEAASSTLTSLTMFQKVMIAVGILWIIGIFALLMCGVVSYIRCKRRTKFSVKRTGNIWECDDLPSPFVLGLWKPQIYVPFHMSKEEYEYIVAHEHYHIKRKDTIIKPLAFMLLAVYWINPLVWLAYVCMVRDMEMSCDEAVLSIFGNEIKQAYSMSLLSFVTGKRNVSFVPLAFGESDASKRIKNVLRYKKPRLISAVVAVLALAVISLVCLTNASETTEPEGENPGSDEKYVASEISQALEKAGSENAGIKVTSNDSIVTKADLDHDGETEQIVVCEKAEDLYELNVQKQDGTLLWSTEASTSHVEWNTILLYQNEGEDYLIQYLPVMYQGIGNYTCTMFSLENGHVSEKNTWKVDFDSMAGITGSMRGFFEAVNYLMENSTALFATEGGNLVIGPQKAVDLQQIYPVNFYMEDGLSEESYEVVYPLELTFCSGAGGWRTTLTLYEDGHFDGIYEDGEAEWTNEYPRGTDYYCEFSGRFREMKKLNEYSYSMMLDELTYKTEVGKEWIKDGVRYIGSDAYGVTGGEKFVLYLPNTPAEILDDNVHAYWPNEYMWRKKSIHILYDYCLYNVNEGAGFFSDVFM